jgi:hypothetical protein
MLPAASLGMRPDVVDGYFSPMVVAAFKRDVRGTKSELITDLAKKNADECAGTVDAIACSL